MVIRSHYPCQTELNQRQALEKVTSLEEFNPMNLLGSPVSALPFERQIELMLHWAQCRLSKTICVANVHMLMEAFWDKSFREILRQSDLVTPDGMPLVRMMQLLGAKSPDRVAGMDIFQTLCRKAPNYNVSIFLLGSNAETLEKMCNNLRIDYPQLHLAGAKPLPFTQKLIEVESQAIIHEINQSGAGFVFVALGCPKQEKWIAAHKGKINSAMLGLGYVFESYAGLKSRAPEWMQHLCLEWLFRLFQEPKRLWKRYIMTIPPFLLLAVVQVVIFKINRLLRHAGS